MSQQGLFDLGTKQDPTEPTVNGAILWHGTTSATRLLAQPDAARTAEGAAPRAP
ncbi:hypothetical protein G7068_10995 [Leucobacter viscericola]|uniref:Uncharacterized protein n=1 Tax=Leucobacter viscericola TaxID=2714935 RepID=A0A6G7XGM9_9MICO|nr:hypothetical protein [Leucobacter viscericola]QIK63662.1 hypothetical protein G7068_10995 [Leucobacter viscericola]